MSRLVPRTYTLAHLAQASAAAPPSSALPAATAPVSAPACSSDDSHHVPAVSIASLTLDTPLIPLRRPRRVPAKPFPFLALPSELRVKVYEHFFSDTDAVIDLGPDNYKRIHKHLGLMRVCRQLHDEATHFFYSSRAFRLFPTHPGRYFKTKKPLLARLKPGQRECITKLELRLGPGWGAPPKGWAVNDALGLKDCVGVRRLSVFVECDPSDGIFKGFRRSEGFYEGFSRHLLGAVVAGLPNVAAVEFDAWPSVKKSGAMMRGLLDVAAQSQRPICWGPERGWTDADGDEDDAQAPAKGEGFLDGNPMQGYAQGMPMVAV